MAESQYRFERLTPTDDVDLSIYENAIDYVFDNTDIRNVAISGAYSAGKSSILASYKKKCRLPAETDICAIFGGHLKT